jgi:S-adenosylmethionine-diacylgycerolhomoserine-N-methlytransferase
VSDLNPDAEALSGRGAIERYYRFHSRIYDATRWSFLFGRQALIDHLRDTLAPANILEVGAGTGRNLRALCTAFPDAQVAGVDVSQDMLRVARRNLGPLASRVELLHRSYDGPVGRRPFDLVVFSYSLSMINPGWVSALEAARADLAPGGHIAVVDFHDSALSWFKRWMAVNHVRMQGHLLPNLEDRFETCHRRIRGAYLGVWNYLTFVGRKPRTT